MPKKVQNSDILIVDISNVNKKINILRKFTNGMKKFRSGGKLEEIYKLTNQIGGNGLPGNMNYVGVMNKIANAKKQGKEEIFFKIYSPVPFTSRKKKVSSGQYVHINLADKKIRIKDTSPAELKKAVNHIYNHKDVYDNQIPEIKIGNKADNQGGPRKQFYTALKKNTFNKHNGAKYYYIPNNKHKAAYVLGTALRLVEAKKANYMKNIKLEIAPHYYMTTKTDNKQNFTRKKEIVNHVNPISKNQKTYINNDKHEYYEMAKKGIDEQYKNIMNSSSRKAFQNGYKNIKPYGRAMKEKMLNKITPSSVNNVLKGTKIYRTTNAINVNAIKKILIKMKRNNNMSNFLITATGSNVCPRRTNSNANKIKIAVKVDENMATNSPPKVIISTCAKQILITHPKITNKNDINKLKNAIAKTIMPNYGGNNFSMT